MGARCRYTTFREYRLLASSSTPRGLTRMTGNHVADERLAKYSKGLLDEPELGEVEEHLLICEQCRMRLTEFDDEWGLNG